MSDRHAVVQLDELPPKRCSCGTTRRAFVTESGGQASIHLLQVGDAVTHHHKVATEYYVVLEGEGEIELDGVRHPARPMSAFLIRPGCRHRAIGDLKVLLVSLPAADDTDEYFDA
ncbi:cupin domain-containing protein [Micromonospora endolithica]|uniref:Cupin domain-containing protein n=1 Tax=Micromonospora endolithica TaxID=230091 RepID=A0A3A9ZHZ3_9ACTN|nr:cupin domain-containing protein [Micromonospora endolithica]RKN47880.1 cupin domain-containing protein [Micromonospora endolithica]TWJ21578.1 Cupin domain-containing protein [Micromonospora endolithica]